MRKLLTAYAVVSSLALTYILITSFSQTQEAAHIPATETEDRKLPQEIRSVVVDKEYTFAGEAIPSDNFDARERLDRELSVNSYWHSSTLLNVKTAGRYFPVIEPILEEYGIPDDFKYLAVIESNLRNVTSPAGAKGIWQFMKPTGKAYGLEINDEVDERYHIEKATRAACEYLSDYHKQFGSWTSAAAAYNMGGPRLKKTLADQGADSYYDINLNSETSRYIFRIIAVKEIMTNPEAFGFFVQEEEIYEPLEYKTVDVSDTVDSWAEFAKDNDISYRMLKVYNPWLIDGKLTCSGKKVYEIKLPV